MAEINQIQLPNETIYDIEDATAREAIDSAVTMTFATVATTGSYNDLTNKPTIPTVPVTDVTVGGSSVVSSGTAVIPAIPAAVEANPTVPSGTTPTALTGVKVGSSYYSVSGGSQNAVTDVRLTDGTSLVSNGIANLPIPSVSSEDNGKVFGVTGGQWDAVEQDIFVFTASFIMQYGYSFSTTGAAVMEAINSNKYIIFFLRGAGDDNYTPFVYSSPYEYYDEGMDEYISGYLFTGLIGVDTSSGSDPQNASSFNIPWAFLTIAEEEDQQTGDYTYTLDIQGNGSWQIGGVDWDEVDFRIGIAVHPVVGTTVPFSGMEPNKLYKLGTITGSKTFTLASPTNNSIENHYFWTFETSSTAPTITWPNAITSWYGGSTPTINANKHYEVSLLNGVAVCMEV